jgi:hypothetical protein
MKRAKGVGRAVTAFAVVCAFSLPVQQASAQSTQTPWRNLTQAQLTAVWWQWAFSVPVSASPLFDDTGVNAYNGQPYSDLLFLAGTFIVQQLQNGDALGTVTRSITVKKGTAFFFPLLNSEFDNVCARPNLGGNCFGAEKFPVVLGVPQMRLAAAMSLAGATGLHATLTGQRLDYSRLQSPPFSFTLPATDNLYQNNGVDVSGAVAPAVADGYFSFTPGLAPGSYQLQFGGSNPFTDAEGNAHTFTEAITYLINVTN